MSEERHVDLLSDYEIDFEDEDFDEGDEMMLETSGGERIAPPGVVEEKSTNESQTNEPASLRLNAINLHGVNTMSTEDVKNYALAFYPDATPLLEWVDDESINLVYENDETAAKALGTFSEDSTENIEIMRTTKPHATSKEHNLRARIANNQDRKVRNAKEYSRYYLLYGDPREEERQRRMAQRRTNRRPKQRLGEIYDVHKERERVPTARKDAVELFPAKKLSSMSKRSTTNKNGDPIELFPEKVNPSVQIGLNQGSVQTLPEGTVQPTDELQQSAGDTEVPRRDRESRNTTERRRRRSASPRPADLNKRFGAGNSLAQLFGSKSGTSSPQQQQQRLTPPASALDSRPTPTSIGSKDKDGAARLQSIFAAANVGKGASGAGGKKKRMQAADHFE